jgi:hypothetical protein
VGSGLGTAATESYAQRIFLCFHFTILLPAAKVQKNVKQ